MQVMGVCEVCTKATTTQYLIYHCLSHADSGVRDKSSGREKPALDFLQLAQKSLTDLDSSITLFQAMLQIVKTADAARAQPATAATSATEAATQPAPASAHHASGVESGAAAAAAAAAAEHASSSQEASSQQRAAQGEEGRGWVASGAVAGVAGDGAAVAASKMASASAPKLVMHTRAHQPFRLLYDVRIHGLESSLAVLESVTNPPPPSANSPGAARNAAGSSYTDSSTDGNVKIGPRMQRVRSEQVWLKGHTLGA